VKDPLSSIKLMMSSLFVKSETRVKAPLLSKSEGFYFFTFSEGPSSLYHFAGKVNE
jgi:hypothetical protein